MKEVSKTFRITKIGNAWHYQRRVPVSLVPRSGKRFWKALFGQVGQAEAIKLRAIEDEKFDAHMASLSGGGHIIRAGSHHRWRAPQAGGFGQEPGRSVSP